ncbi:uncharacterized protein METZ01_LOCUS474827, partial [marine metagenome]
ELKVSEGPLRLRFSEPIDPETANKLASYKIKTWDLRRTRGYGSRHYNEKPLKIESVNLTENGRLLELKTPDLQPTWCMEILYNLKTAKGQSISNRIHNTIHGLAKK